MQFYIQDDQGQYDETLKKIFEEVFKHYAVLGGAEESDRLEFDLNRLPEVALCKIKKYIDIETRCHRV